MERLPSPGVFWIPESPEIKIAGQLEGQPGSILLNLTGHLDNSDNQNVTIGSSYFEDMDTIPVVHGVIRKALITLLDLSKTGISASFPGLSESSYFPKYVVFGEHLDKDTANLPIGLSVRFSHLLHWHGTRGLIGSFSESNGGPLSAEWHYTYPSPFDWSVPGYEISLRGGLNPKSEWGSLNAAEYGYFTIRALTPKSIGEWHIEIISPLYEMVKFAIFSSVSMERIRLLFASGAGDPNLGSLDHYGAELVINSPKPSTPVSSRLTPSEMLFSADDVSEVILENLLNTDSPTTTIRQRFTYYEQTKMRRDDFFLAYVRLIESFHRRLNPISQEKIDGHLARINNIAKLVNDADRSLILGRLGYAYEPSLESRIHALTKPWKMNLKEIAGGKALLGTEIKKIASHRNFLAHELPEEQRVLGAADLRRACLFVIILARLAALHQAGFSQDAAWDAVSRTDIFADMKSRYRQ